MAMGMAGFRGRMWSSAEEATVGAREPEKRCREECRMERVCDDRGCEGRCVMRCQEAVRAAILVAVAGDVVYRGCSVAEIVMCQG